MQLRYYLLLFWGLLSPFLFGQQKRTTTQLETVKVDSLRAGGSVGVDLNGSGVRIGMWEAPLSGNYLPDTSLSDLSAVKVQQGTGTSSHATTVAKILASQGVSNPSQEGVAPSAEIYAFTYDYPHTTLGAEIGQAIEDYNLLISNHSYAEINGWTSGTFWSGVIDMSETEDYKFGYYGSESRMLDSIMEVYPYHLAVKAVANDRGDANSGTPFSVYSSSNFNVVSRSSPIPEANGGADGYDGLARDATSKNALCIGAVDNISGGFSSVSDFSFANSKSAYGPTDDARVKPDLVAPGQLTSGTAYTSYAAPIVSGMAALMQELYRSENGRWMKSSTAKALLIHTADAGTTDGSPLPTMGWGMPNAVTAAEFVLNGDGNQRIIEGELENGETKTFRFYLDGNSDFRATLVWTDPVGTSPSLEFNSTDLDDSVAILVHDLDIEFWEESGPSLVAQPWKLSAANPGNSAWRGDNSVDNVERIDYPSGSLAAGWYTIRLSHDGSLSKTQEFSLLISDAGGITFSAGSWSTAPASWETDVFVRIVDTSNIAVISEDVTVSFLEMAAGSALQINEANLLTVSGEALLKSSADGTAQIKGRVSGVVCRQSYISGNADWRSISTPLRTTAGNWAEELSHVEWSSSSTPSIYSWDAVNSQWVALSQSDSLNDFGAVSLYMGSNIHSEFTQLPFTKSMRGKPVNRNVTLSLEVDDDVSSSDDEKGWNLIGNPYLAALDWQGLDVSQTGGSFYIWNPAESDFAISDGANFTLGGRRHIPAGQGFWVYCPSGSSGSLLMDSSAVKLTVDPGFTKTVQSQLRVSWFMNDGRVEDVILIPEKGASLSFNIWEDVPMRQGGDPARSEMFWGDANEPCAIARVPSDSGVITLSFSPGTSGLDSLRVTTIATESIQFYWEQDSVSYPLHGVPSSVWDKGGEINLHWNGIRVGLEESSVEGRFVYFEDALFWSENTPIKASIFDMNGREVRSIEWTDFGWKSIRLSPGTYILRSEEGHVLKFVQP
ncbi:MAG: S8 family serine peptidase [Flavobacteriia bacterium]|nr:S8 family serine peptidase [Flavobacteriia bacterium]